MRYFLIDRVTELVPGERARGIKNVTLSDEVLHDHFPDFPVMPGALLLEAVAQLAGFLLEVSLNSDASGPVLRAMPVQIHQARFYEPCTAGDQLDVRVAIESILDRAARVSSQIQVGDKRALRAQLTFVMREVDSERLHEQRRYIYGLWTRRLETPVAIR